MAIALKKVLWPWP